MHSRGVGLPRPLPYRSAHGRGKPTPLLNGEQLPYRSAHGRGKPTPLLNGEQLPYRSAHGRGKPTPLLNGEQLFHEACSDVSKTSGRVLYTKADRGLSGSLGNSNANNNHTGAELWRWHAARIRYRNATFAWR